MAPPDDNKPRNPWGNGPGGGEPPPRGPWDKGGNNKGGNKPSFDQAWRGVEAKLRQYLPGGAHPGATVALAAIVIAILWLASGLYILVPGQQGVIQHFGAWSRTQTAPGLGYHLPWPVETVDKISVNETRRMEIGFTEDHQAQGPGGPQDLPAESLMLTSDANIIDVDLVVFWNIKSAEDYAFNILDPEATIHKVAESAIREVVGQTEMFPILTTDRELVAERTRAIMAKTLDSYKSGVNITQVLIQEAAVPTDVQEAFQDVQSAKQDAFGVQNQAEAYAQDILPKARGQATRIQQDAAAYKESQIARATGDAQRFDAVEAAYRAGPDVTERRLYLETMEDVLKTAQKTIIDNKGGVVPYFPLDHAKTAPSDKPEAAALGGPEKNP